MPTPTGLFVQQYFPKNLDIPFGEYLNQLFFNPRQDNLDFVIHGPNVVRLTRALVNNRLREESGLLTGTDEEQRQTFDTYYNTFKPINQALELRKGDHKAREKVEALLSIAAMFHDIGKTIRRGNHP